MILNPEEMIKFVCVCQKSFLYLFKVVLLLLPNERRLDKLSGLYFGKKPTFFKIKLLKMNIKIITVKESLELG